MAAAVLFERYGRVALFTFNRPEQRNAVNPEVSQDMNRHMLAFEADPDLWVGIVTAAGDRAFCAGADLKAIAAGRLAELVDVEPYGFAGVARGARHKPLIAAVDGSALAGGFEVAIACDLIVASERATFGLPEVRRGIIAGAGGLQRLPRLIPPMRALELILTGRSMTATEALAVGLISEIVPAGTAVARARELAQVVAANAPIAVRASLRVARAAIGTSEAAAWTSSEAAWTEVLASEDATEGPLAFAEGRQPEWRGR